MTDVGVDWQAIQTALDGKTKPVGSLGRLEDLAAQIARIQGTLAPKADSCRLIIFAGDHGMARAGVSAYPQEVTGQMVANFLSGGAAATVFARTLGVDVWVVDTGVVQLPPSLAGLLDLRIGAGTANAIDEPAMSSAQLEQALSNGESTGSAIAEDAACFGEMGIGNTASSSLLASKLLGEPVGALTGPGTGLDDEGLRRKVALLEKAAARTPTHLPAKDALIHYGGFEIATMAGAMIGAAKTGRLVLIDGFIASVAALCAVDLNPASRSAFIFAHRSAEPGHDRVLSALQAQPLLELDMRLGEGTGALLAWPLVRAAAAMLREMASFSDAGVSGPQ